MNPVKKSRGITGTKIDVFKVLEIIQINVPFLSLPSVSTESDLL